MNIRKNLSLAVSAGVTIVLIVVAAVFMVRFAISYGTVTWNLRTQQEKLQRLNDRRPYPSEENIRQLEANREALAAILRRTQEDLSRGQYEPPALEPARFSQELRGMSERLNRVAASRNIAPPPPSFGYGFEQYFKGVPPRKDEVPRLLLQVNAVESVCRALYEAGITEILKVERQNFEEAGAGGGPETDMSGLAVRAPFEERGAGGFGGRLDGRPMADPDGLFSWERVAVEFTTRESGLWAALNGLARAGAYTVVNSLTIVNENARPAIKTQDGGEKATRGTEGAPVAYRPPSPPAGDAFPPGMAPGAAGALPARPLKREERIVAGRDELLRVRVEADVYRFQAPTPAG